MMMTREQCVRLRLVLGDQLNPGHRWFEAVEPDTLYVLAEVREEATYARHHVQKISGFFAAMERFAKTIDAAGHRVIYLDLDDTSGFAGFGELLPALIEQTGARLFEYQRPDEYRLQTALASVAADAGVETRCAGTGHFMVPFEALADEFPRGKQLRMEHFYRRMRRSTGYLMQPDGKPVGERWNYDAENRKSLPAQLELPEPRVFDNDVGQILARISKHGIETYGRLEGSRLDWPIDRAQSLQLLKDFVGELLPLFGAYQDAITDRGWSLFHSRLSFSLNTKMVSPVEVVEAVLAAWAQEPDRFPLSSVEGFIRQVIGWREFMRGIYWSRMPDYASSNALGHKAELPEFYWTGKTRMACMSQALGQTRDHAYAHHIQRLMVTGNFALLIGAHPDAVDAWYLGVYIDAIEWVEMPNTRGMSQFADGGVIASKPYVSSGNYINKMGDQCRACHYDVKQREGPKACPFNPLYWHFMTRHRDRLAVNPRIGMIYRSWDRMDDARRQAILETAEQILADPDAL